MRPRRASTLRCAIVGAGPAGFYAAEQLLAEGFEVDLLDALPTPFGLVRSGVAPDHPKIKSVTRVFDRTAGHPGFRFFGGAELGSEVGRHDLLERYHAVVYAVGTARDNRLGIPGEDLPGSHAATGFVAWYNGHPRYAHRTFDLSAKRAVVVGNGNVAIDVARMLVLDRGELAPTDTADHALEAFSEASVEEVLVLGRRGPAQAAFTNPELRELGELARADVVVDPAEVELDDASAAWLESDAAGATARRNIEVLRTYARRPAPTKSHRIVLRFLHSPVEIVSDEEGSVARLRVVRNRVEVGPGGVPRAIPTGHEETIDCGLVLRSIGYRGGALPGIPFDERRGRISNDGGRVCDAEGSGCRASTPWAGSSAGRAASSAPTRRTPRTPSPGSSRTVMPRGSTNPPTPIRMLRPPGSRRSCPASSPGGAGQPSTPTSGRPVNPTAARA
jgi:ferredoxin/flavodoxin---NADP+ reductase